MRWRLMRGLGLAVIVGLAACGGNSGNSGSAVGAGDLVLDKRLAQCMIDSPRRNVGQGLDAPGRLEVAMNAGSQPAGPCQNNTRFRFGSGLYDITGVAANTGGMGWESPTQVLSGIHTRQYARAFALASPCNGKRVVFVSTDTGMIFGSVRQGVLATIAADPILGQLYSADNIMLSATHTHSGPAGYSHHEAFNLLHFGFDATALAVIVNGIVEAIKLAHANLDAHPGTSSIRLAVGELLNTNINRSLPAFEMNTDAERGEFLNSRGEPVEVDKRFVQLNLVRENGSAAGVINWFGVHPTVIGPTQKLVSSDNKGYASLRFERIMRTRYDAPAGVDNFVAAFAQTDEGDSSPNIFIVERPHPDPTRGGGVDDFDSNAISGTKQLAKSLELFSHGVALSGPVDFRFFHVRMDQITVADPAVLASLRHPPELDAPVKRTCLATLGVSFGAGAEDGPGFTDEGVACGDAPDVVAAAAADFMAGAAGHIPPYLASTAVLCNVDQLPLLDLSCHAEKPILFVIGPPLNAEPSIVPFQLFRIGNLAVFGIPWEVTTMSARRLRQSLLEVLAPVGIDTIIVAGLINDYSHYLTTREEYSSQQYEGGSTIFGPWSLAAVQQEASKLATSMRENQPAPAGPAYVDGMPVLQRLPYVPADLPLPSAYGALVTDVPATTAPGDTVRAEFQAGHPRNDLKTQSSYVYVERKGAGDSWEVVFTDKDPELLFVWKPLLPSLLPLDLPIVSGLSSTAEAVWTIPKNTPLGTYRLRHEGTAQTLLLPKEEYSGTSSPFTVDGSVAECPD
ncbi:MAG: neutral/alkaline non-lysosomal ceramidase N-terminal domain-containing protein [Nevskiales bacterium]